MEKTVTPEHRSSRAEQVKRDMKVSAAYDDVLERMTGKREAPPDVEFGDLTADFTEAQWTEFKRLVKQLCAERDLEAEVDEQVDSWREDQAEQQRDIVEKRTHGCRPAARRESAGSATDPLPATRLPSTLHESGRYPILRRPRLMPSASSRAPASGGR